MLQYKYVDHYSDYVICYGDKNSMSELDTYHEFEHNTSKEDLKYHTYDLADKRWKIYKP